MALYWIVLTHVRSGWIFQCNVFEVIGSPSSKNYRHSLISVVTISVIFNLTQKARPVNSVSYLILTRESSVVKISQHSVNFD